MSNFGCSRVPSETKDGAACTRIPVRSAETCKRRNEVQSGAFARALRQKFNLGGALQNTYCVAQPLHHATCHEDAALECIGRARVDAPRSRREKPILRRENILSGVNERKTACAVRRFDFAFGKTRLPERSRLLVAGHASDGNGRAKQVRGCIAKSSGAVPNLRQNRARDFEQREQLLIPLKRVQIEEHRARGVGHVRRVHAPARETKNQPAVDGAKG